MAVIACDPYKTIADPHVRQAPFETLLGEADFVVCLAVANEQTESLVNASTFGHMKKSAFFINLSRGNLVDEAALSAALRENHIAGAAMDVGRAPDQMPTPELAKLPNVIATPHVGGLTPQAIEYQSLETVRQVEAIAKGEVPPGAVNAEHWTRRP
jgi:D-3-phosphoglycerate dehydrogenase